MFQILDGREQFYQWDLNRKLIVLDDDISEVHFCNRTGDCSLVCEVYSIDGIYLVNVPNVLLQNDWPINVYAYDGSYTKHSESFKIVKRTKPTDYVYTETEIKRYEDLEERITALEENGGAGGGGTTVISGITTAQFNALDAMFKVCAYIKSDISAEYNAFVEAFTNGEVPDVPDIPDEPDVPVEKILVSISATYTGGEVPVGTAPTALTGITVKAHYSDGTSATITGYTLSGAIGEGNNTITVSYSDKTTTFVVVGVAEPDQPDEPGELTEAVYRLANETVFDDTTEAIDTGYVLLDVDKSYTVCVDFTDPSGATGNIWSASPNASKGLELSNRGGYYRSIYTLGIETQLGNGKGNYKVIVSHEKGTENIIIHYSVKGGEMITVKKEPSGLLTNINYINGSPKSISVGSTSYVGTIHKFEIYERVITENEINEFMGVSE